MYNSNFNKYKNKTNLKKEFIWKPFNRINVKTYSNINNKDVYEDNDIEEEIKSSISYCIDNATIYIDGEISEDDGMIFEKVVDSLKVELDEFSELTVCLNTFGGVANAGFHIISVIEELKAQGIHVRTIVAEKAYSMGAFILICGSERIMREYSQIMIHPCILVIDGYYALTINEIRKNYKHFNKQWKLFKKCFNKYAQIPSNLLNKIYKEGIDYYIDANKALKFKCIDKII